METNGRAGSNRIYIWLILFLCVCSYLVLAGFSLGKPVVADEVGWMTACTDLGFLEVARGYSDFSGPKFRLLYTHPVDLLLRAFGTSGESGRLLGILSVLMTLPLIYGIAGEVFKGRRDLQAVGLTACVLYAIHPMVIQGSLILGEDNTILTPMVYLYFFCFLRCRESRQIVRVAALGVLLNLVLWVKPTPLPFIVFAMAVAGTIGKGFKKGVLETSAITAIGVGLYLILWWVYSEAKDLPFLLPFENLSGHIAGQQVSGTLFDCVTQLIKRATRLIIWGSPFLILLGVVATVTRIKQFYREKTILPIDVLILYLWSMFVGYLLVGGMTFGFPRYHFPMLPALSIVAASLVFQLRSVVDRKKVMILGLLILFLLLYNSIVVRDLLYTINYELRESLIDDAVSTRTVLLKFALQFLLYSIPLIAVFFIARTFVEGRKFLKALSLSLFVCTVAASLALDVTQARAGYNTRYEYGGSPIERVTSLLVERVSPGGVILSTETVVYNYNRVANGNSPYFRPSTWEKGSFIRTLEESKPQAVVYGVSLNTVGQLRETFNNPEIQDLLESRFDRRQVGSYTVWLAK